MRQFRYQQEPTLRPRLAELLQVLYDDPNVHRAAKKMKISVLTARSYLSDVRQFLGKRDATTEELVGHARERGLI